MFSRFLLFVSFLAAATTITATVWRKTPSTSLPKSSLSASDLGLSRTRLSVTSVDSNASATLFSSTLILCTQSDCSGCFVFSLVGLPKDVCLIPDLPVNFLSVLIDNPTAIALDIVILVGDCNSRLTAIPITNTCYNLPLPGGAHFAIINGLTP